MNMDPLQKFRALIMVSCSKILATTKDKNSEHLGVSNANLGDKKEAQNSTHLLREAPGTTILRPSLPGRILKGQSPSFMTPIFLQGPAAQLLLPVAGGALELPATEAGAH